MKVQYLFALAALIPLSGYSHNETSSVIPHVLRPLASNQVELIRSNEADFEKTLQKAKRTIDVPTHIIRTEGAIDKAIECEEVLKFIDDKIVHPIVSRNFTYNMYITCGYDRTTNYATNFYINTYLDPLSDKAVAFLGEYLKETQGLDVFGTTLQIEEAKGVVIANNLVAGTYKKPNKPPFILNRQDRSNFWFSSNYEFAKVMLTEVYANFYSDDPDKILPFLNRWLFPSAGFTYYYILLDSNYTELQPERIFMMQKEGDIFVSNLRYYFGHLCHKHEHGQCLNPSR